MSTLETKLPEADNILLGLGWVMKDGIRVVSRVLLNNGRTNLSEDAESLREGLYNTLDKLHIDKVRERC